MNLYTVYASELGPIGKLGPHGIQFNEIKFFLLLKSHQQLTEIQIQNMNIGKLLMPLQWQDKLDFIELNAAGAEFTNRAEF